MAIFSSSAERPKYCFWWQLRDIRDFVWFASLFKNWMNFPWLAIGSWFINLISSVAPKPLHPDCNFDRIVNLTNRFKIHEVPLEKCMIESKSYIVSALPNYFQCLTDFNPHFCTKFGLFYFSWPCRECIFWMYLPVRIDLLGPIP